MLWGKSLYPLCLGLVYDKENDAHQAVGLQPLCPGQSPLPLCEVECGQAGVGFVDVTTAGPNHRHMTKASSPVRPYKVKVALVCLLSSVCAQDKNSDVLRTEKDEPVCLF